MAVLVVILSIFLTYKVCKVLFRNTIGTTMAYISRAFIVWMIVTAILSGIGHSIGLF